MCQQSRRLFLLFDVTGMYWFLSSELGIEGEASAYSLQHIQTSSGDAALQIATPYSSNENHKPKRRRRNSDGTWSEWVNNC